MRIFYVAIQQCPKWFTSQLNDIFCYFLNSSFNWKKKKKKQLYRKYFKASKNFEREQKKFPHCYKTTNVFQNVFTSSIYKKNPTELISKITANMHCLNMQLLPNGTGLCWNVVEMSRRQEQSKEKKLLQKRSRSTNPYKNSCISFLNR